MEEERLGWHWNEGDRVRYRHPDPKRRDIVEGVIDKKDWGVEKGTEIYRFLVIADGESDRWSVQPGQLQKATGEPTDEPVNRRADIPLPPSFFKDS
ncbi:hypothetical protein [Arthrobacter nitrophenolicus]|uniref:Uncharacterized protein n=1 Tax=Arthrobacter nitrophenolicus TaxID=683150 RepID=A0ACC6THW6_9MICC|nr:hypothetical protein [Arthrobacter nitrophenolicus]